MKLFRNLRMSFINAENFKKYAVYAIGEILLVMVGISLAFQLDNWNEERIKLNTAKGHYKNIKDQISSDKILIEGQITYNTAFLEMFDYANKLIETNNRTQLDTLGVIVGNLTQYSDFNKEGNIYETMVNSGEIKLLKNLDVVNGLRILEEKYHYMNRMEKIHYDAMIMYVVSSITEIIKFSNGEVIDEEALFSVQFQNLILSILQIMEEKDQVYKEALNEIANLTHFLDQELQN